MMCGVILHLPLSLLRSMCWSIRCVLITRTCAYWLRKSHPCWYVRNSCHINNAFWRTRLHWLLWAEVLMLRSAVWLYRLPSTCSELQRSNRSMGSHQGNIRISDYSSWLCDWIRYIYRYYGRCPSKQQWQCQTCKLLVRTAQSRHHCIWWWVYPNNKYYSGNDDEDHFCRHHKKYNCARDNLYFKGSHYECCTNDNHFICFKWFGNCAEMGTVWWNGLYWTNHMRSWVYLHIFECVVLSMFVGQSGVMKMPMTSDLQIEFQVFLDLR